MATLHEPNTANCTAAAEECSGKAVPNPGVRSRLAARRRLLRTRPASLVAAAGAVGLTLIAAGASPPTTADSEATSRSVGVAEALGLDGTAPDGPVGLEQAQHELGQLTASRAQREAAQADAAADQAQAEQAAVDARAEAEARAAAAAAAHADAVFPIDGARVTSPFGPRGATQHTGVDLAAPMLTPEYAAMDGVVLQAGTASGFGLAVYIQHRNGDVTVYGHMEQILVEAGQVVEAGDTIALVGNRGQSTGPHLHFEVRLGGVRGIPVDPLAYLRERGVDV